MAGDPVTGGAGGTTPSGPGAAPPGESWLDRLRQNAARSWDEARTLWASRGQEPASSGDSPADDDPHAAGGAGGTAPDAATRPLRVLGAGRAPTWIWEPPSERPADAAAAVDDAAGTVAADGAARLPNPVLAAWDDPGRRGWLLGGLLCLLVVVGMILAGPQLSRRLAPPPAATQPQQEAPAPGAEGQPAAPAGEQPAGEQPAPAQPAPAQPAGRLPASMSQLALAALPLLLGLFWLLSAWLVDAEARRAFVVQEPWGERRTVAYSCLAVGCVFPLILAGLLFAAYGFVSFVVFVANRQSWVAGIQAGAIILLVCLLVLIARSLVARRLADRRLRL